MWSAAMLSIWIMLLLLLALPDAHASNSTASKLLKRVRRIVGGEFADVSYIPYLVNIRKNGIFHCGGSLITPKCVLTAAHCVRESGPADFIVRGGVTYLDELQNSRRVAQIFVPSQFDWLTLNYDVAVFLLAAPLQGANIETIDLSDELPATEEFVRVSGWGFTSEAATFPPNQMRTVQLRVTSQQLCRSLYMDYRNITEEMFCAAIPGKKDACSADSGGPAVAHGQLAGIVSWGRGYECARVGSPGVYVAVKAVKPWLDAVMRQYCY